MLMKMRSQMQRTNNQKGFTLVELMVVVVIIGILVAIAVPVYNNVTEKANKNAVEANLRTIDGAIMQYGAANNGSVPTKEQLYTTGGTSNYLQVWPSGPDLVAYTINATSGKAEANKGTKDSKTTGNWFTGTEPKTIPVEW